MEYRPTVELVLASKNINTGTILWTFKLKMPKSYLAQLNTHRLLSRNASSSRAVPIDTMINKIKSDTVIPMQWVKNKKGMSGDSTISLSAEQLATERWLFSLEKQLNIVRQLESLNLHKQYANRLLEPYVNAEVLVSATQWSNFIALRSDHATQPELQSITNQIKAIQSGSKPRVLSTGEWHLPFITDLEENLPLDIKQKISVARCARVSYYLKDTCELSDTDKDIALFNRLKESGHWSPFEHIATPHTDNVMCGNYLSWVQLRHSFDDSHDDIGLDTKYATRQELKQFLHKQLINKI